MALVNPSKVLSFVMKALSETNPQISKKILNVVMAQAVPFNRPLGFKIQKWTPQETAVEIPFRRANKNHLGGLHACAIATVGEYAAGILILRHIDPARQRLVLKSLRTEYSKQGRAVATATVQWPSSAPSGESALRTSSESHDIEMTTVVSDRASKAELARVFTTWQVKPWDQVRKK